MIDPNAVSTIRVGELSPEPFSLTDNVPHEVGTELKRGTIEDLATFISAFIGSTDGVGFRAISVTDGQTLPTTTQQEFILVGKGTYYNVVGGSTIICNEELNAIVSNGSYWFIGVEIPINVELAGITQFIRDGFINTTPSEDTVHEALALKSNVADSENIANKQNSLAIDGTGTKYPTVDAVNTGLGLKENILNNPITGVGSQNNANTYALQDGTILYHSVKWFIPTSTVSTNGTTVTSVGTQFTSAMVGAKLTINGEWRIITAFTSTTVVTVASAYSQNYSNVVAGNWGCYSRCSSITSTGNVYYYSYQGVVMFAYISSDQSNVRFSGFSMINNEVAIQPGGALLKESAKIFWSNDATYYGTKDLGLRRNSAGVLEIYDGITPTGLEANRRDLLARKLFGSKVLIGSIVDDNVNQGQYTGTVSSGTTALNNTPPIANNQLTRKDYVDTGLALKANLASPSLTGTPTAPTAPAGTNTTQIATTAFVNGGLATKENAFSKNTAFNKNFGTTAGTVVEGGTLGSNAYSSTNFAPLNGTGANGTWGINISGNAGTATTATNSSKWNNQNFEYAGIGSISDYIIGKGADGTWRPASVSETRDWLGLGSNAYSSTAYLPLSGGDINGLLKITRVGYQLSLTGSDQGAIDLYKSGTLGHRLFSDFSGFGIYDLAANGTIFSISKSTGAANFSSSVTATSFNGSATLTGTPTAPTAPAGTNTTQIATTAFVLANSSARPYKVYTALISQSGTSAPVATVLENTLGGTVVWSRISEGVYVGTLANGFSLTLSKVRIFISGGEPHLNTTGFYNALPNNINSVQVNTKNTSGSLADSLMSAGATIEIRVYL